MENKMLNLIQAYYPLEKQDVKEFETIKVGGMKFHVQQYYAKDFGNISRMSATGMFGLMKMDTIIINPFHKDMPLFSYDFIQAMKNNTLLIEQYDTLLDSSIRDIIQNKMKDLITSFDKVKDEPYESHWYDSLYLDKVSFRKKGKNMKDYFETITLKYLKEYLEISIDIPQCDPSLKKEAARKYTEGLLSHGGPSTDVFIKKKGKEFTGKLFREVLFGTN